MLFNRNKTENKYIFNSLKLYCMDQHVGGKRKYRKVFEKSEVAYLGMELAIFNKLFDEKDWKTEITIWCNYLSGEEEQRVVERVTKVKIPKEDNIFQFFFGWGRDEKGDYWIEGEYEWLVFIEEELIASTKAHIVDVGPVTADRNPYFSAVSLRTYESPKDDLEAGARKYLKTFNQATTRYIMGELSFVNHVNRNWPLEVFFNFYDDCGLFIGVCEVFLLVNADPDPDAVYEISGGIGFEETGSWIEDNYTVEVVFMNTLVAVLPFSVGEKNIESPTENLALLNEEVELVYRGRKTLSATPNPQSQEPEAPTTPIAEPAEEKQPRVDPRPVEEIMAELNGLIGLENIKAKIREYVDYIQFLKFRKESGIEENEAITLHSVFTGAPGTGKTTVVKLLGKILHSLGLLSKGHVHSVEASDLISGYIRNTGPETKKHIEKARGGILFIDEAYNLFKADAKSDFGPDAVAALITEMSDGEGDLAIMVAGYPEEMQAFLESNPGLKSRFRNFFHFANYSPQELLQIAEYAAKKKALMLSDGAREKLKHILTQAFRNRDRTFGNARFAFSLIEEAKINLGTRLMRSGKPKKWSKKELSTLLETDIEAPGSLNANQPLKLELDENLLQEAMEQLNHLVGLDEIKQEVSELVKLSRYYRENGWNVLNAFSMHSVFTGNPGTGKTTVARILAKVYKALGMLERGHLIEADGSDLVAGYVGQTALKTKEIVQESMEGVLFVDEAYAITDGQHSDFGHKAIATLVKEMEDHRHEFGLIVAGYPRNMEQFLSTNPGLKSRFDQHFHFEDFSEAELWEIALKMLRREGLIPSKDAIKHLKLYISFLFHHRDRFFGNARTMRKIVEKASRNQKLRMAELPKSERTKKQITTLTLEDVEEFDPENLEGIYARKLGFRMGGNG